MFYILWEIMEYTREVLGSERPSSGIRGQACACFAIRLSLLNMGLRDLGNSGLYMSGLLEKYLFPFFSVFLSVHVARCQFKIH